MTEETAPAEAPVPFPIVPDHPALQQGQMGMIHRALWAVKRDLPAISRDGTLEIGGKPIAFTRIEDIRKALYPLFEKHGIMLYPVFVDGHDELQVAAEMMNTISFSDEVDAEGKKTGAKIMNPRGEVRDGRLMTTRYWATVTYDINFIYVGDGSGVVVRTKGLAYDTNSDKAVGKATTAAIKRALSETFDIIDDKEDDENPTDDDPRNRPSTTDRRSAEGGDRGVQQRAAATASSESGSTRRSGPQRSASTRPSPAAARAKDEAEQAAEETSADPRTGEVPEPEAPPAESELDKAKARVRDAVAKLGYDPATVNAIAAEVTGKAERSEWIVLPTAVKKLADRLEADVEKAGKS